MLKRFFLHCSGADIQLLSDCSQAEQNKFVGIGATVFFTALMATIAASYALYTVFDNVYAAVFFGLVWGLLVFNLDRFIVSTIKKRDRKLHEFTQALPRIFLAIIIAIVIAKPLELKIFEKEINRVLLEKKNDLSLANKSQIALQYSPEISALTNQIKRLKEEVNNKEAAVNALYNTYIAEAEGTSGTLKLGKGPVYKEKREKHDAALQELQTLNETNALKISTIEQAIGALKLEQEAKINNTQPIIDNFDGLMARINALNKLPWLPSFFIFLLFLAIETAPIIAKLLAPKGTYDIKLEDLEHAAATWMKQKVHQSNELHKTDVALNNKVYDAIAEEEALYAYKKKMAEKLMQNQADAFYQRQQKNLF